MTQSGCTLQVLFENGKNSNRYDKFPCFENLADEVSGKESVNIQGYFCFKNRNEFDLVSVK
jgi:hypothetical protein